MEPYGDNLQKEISTMQTVAPKVKQNKTFDIASSLADRIAEANKISADAKATHEKPAPVKSQDELAV